MYLREMGTVPLLTREGEVEIAKRIERGQMRVMKAISRSSIVIREIVGLGEDLKRGVRNIKEVVIFDEEEITEEILQARVRQTVGRIDALVKHQKKAALNEEKLAPHQPQGESERASQDPLDHRAREGLRIADCSRAEVHQPGAQASSRQGQQDRRRDAHARTADPHPRPEVRPVEERGAAQGIPSPAEELQDRSRKARAGCRRLRSPTSSARSAR